MRKQQVSKDKRLKPSYEILIGHNKDTWYITADDKIVETYYSIEKAKEALDYWKENL